MLSKILLKLPCYMIKCNCWSGWSCSWGSWREHWLCWLRSHFIDNIAASDKTGVGWLHLTTITIKSEIQIFLFVDSCLPYNIVSSDIIWKCWCWTGWSHLTDKKIKIKIYIYCFNIPDDILTSYETWICWPHFTEDKIVSIHTYKT